MSSSSGFRYRTGERVSAVVSLMYLALTQPALAETVADVYAIARGYERVGNPALHFNLACIAGRLGRSGDVLRHVERSLALDWADAAQIHDDNDLAAMRGDPAFEKLFIADAARRAAVAQAAAAEAAVKLAKEHKRAERAAKAANKPAEPKPAKPKPAKPKPAKPAKKPAKRKR